jgi:hypothetical protein
MVLLRMGWKASATGEAGTLRYMALMLATFVVCLASLALAATHATYAGRAHREIARAPVTHLPGSPHRPVVRWGAGFDTVDDRQYSVVFIEPLVPGAPLPPGVTRWPGPGQAILSPALIDAGSREAIRSRFGTVAGTIGTAGLSVPGERLAYVRPPAGLLPTSIMQDVEGFGSPSQPPLGDGLFVQSESTFLIMVACLTLLPAVVLLAIAIRTGAKRRDERFALIATLGGGRTARALISLGDMAVPIVAGVLGGLGVAAILATFDLHIPFADFRLAATDMSGSIGTLISACLLAGLISAAAVVGVDTLGLGRSRSTRPGPRRRAPVRAAALAPLMLLVATRGPDLFTPGSPLHLLVNYIGVAGTLLTLPAVVGLGARTFGSLLALAARRLRLSGSLLAGRWMAAEPAALSRATAGIIAVVCILIQVQVWTNFLGSPVRDARAAVAIAGPGLQIVKTKSDASPAQLADFYAAISDFALPIELMNDPSTKTLRIVGSCPALRLIDLPCQSPAQAEVQPHQARTRMLIDIADTPGYSVVTAVADPADQVADKSGFSLAVLVTANGTALDRPAVEAAAYRTLPGGADVSRVGGDWLIGANVNADHGRWIIVLGVFGVVVLALACALGALAEYTRWSRVLAPVGVVSGTRRVFWTAAAWSVFVPIAFAGAIATPIGTLLAFPQTEGGWSSVSPSLLAACALGIGFIGLVVYAWALKASRDITRQWLPGHA